jgi:hypothetical protein
MHHQHPAAAGPTDEQRKANTVCMERYLGLTYSFAALELQERLLFFRLPQLLSTQAQNGYENPPQFSHCVQRGN